ncbi:WD40/YVTN/BNR-like repeat-containing protein [Massilia horti]|uniref:Uncharacterized protein n=1 Tax=Massilia horti TaxID=2562153 RepID=A0A4Y9T2A3_9BURK|nr:hypothetical protein [Massilia horti]TFW33626.1 hypothetical protein E4O92_06430 [Massilia horti]
MALKRAVGWLGATLALAGAISVAQAQTETDDSGYRSAQDFRTFQAAGEDEEDRPSVIGRLEWMKARYGATLPPDLSRRMVQELQNQRNTYPQLAPGAVAPNGVPRWQSIGPTRATRKENELKLGVTDSGRLRNILPHPTDPNTVYLLSSGGGIWKTTNFEAPYPTWTPITDKVITTSGGAAAFGRDPQTLYYGTGDPFDGAPMVGAAMLKTTDGGNTWSPFVFLGPSGVVGDLKVDTRGPVDVVLVGTNTGLYRSADGGNTYDQVLGRVGMVWSIARTSIGWLATTAANGFFSPATLYQSNDGINWAPLAVPNLTNSAGRITLAVGAPGDPVVYAYAAGSCDAACLQKDLYRSVDGGYSWTALGLKSKAPSNPNEENPTMDLMRNQANYNQMVVVDPSDPTRNTVYLGGRLNTGKTTDGGKTWRLQSNWMGQFGLPYVHADHHTAVVSMAGGKKRVMFGSDGGLFVSYDEGVNWNNQKNTGLVDHLIYAMATSGADPKSVLVGMQDNGTRIRSGNTGVFNESYGGDGFGVGWSQSGNVTVLGSSTYGFIVYSQKDPNIQKKWTEPTFDPATCTYNGINACNAYFVTPIATPSATADPGGKTYFTNTASLIYRTDNAGASWRPIFSGDPRLIYIRGTTHSLAVSPVDLNHIAAVSTGTKILITTDGGAHWDTRNVAVPGYTSFNSSIAWANNSVLYVASEHPFGQSVWVVKSTDGGLTWAAASRGLPNVPIQKLLAAPNDPSGNTVYAATWIGVYRTVDGGATWSQFGAGLPTVQVSDLYMPADGSFLRASTYGRGVWDLPLR